MPEPELSRDTRLTISPSVTSRQLDDELILLDLRGGEYFSLNRSGAAVWQALADGHDLAQIDDEVAGQWPVPPEERWQMISAIVTELLKRGLVERRG